MSSIAPRVARELAARAAAAGAAMLDAPVSGGDKGAIAGTLSIMVGGTEAAFERALARPPGAWGRPSSTSDRPAPARS